MTLDVWEGVCEEVGVPVNEAVLEGVWEGVAVCDRVPVTLVV